MATNLSGSSSLLRIPAGKGLAALKIAEATARQTPDARFKIEATDDELVFWDMNIFDPDALAAVAQAVIDALQIDEPFLFHWAEWCSRPRTDEFFGGYGIVRRGRTPEIHWPPMGAEEIDDIGQLARTVYVVGSNALLTTGEKLSIFTTVLRASNADERVASLLCDQPIVAIDRVLREAVISAMGRYLPGDLYLRWYSQVPPREAIAVLEYIRDSVGLEDAIDQLVACSWSTEPHQMFPVSAEILEQAKEMQGEAIERLNGRLTVL